MSDNGTLATAGGQAIAFFTDDQQRMIRNTYATGASKEEFEVLIEIAKTRQLNPLLGQIHFVKRPKKVGDRYVDVWATQVAVDGFRVIAERTGKYDGQDEPIFEYDNNGRALRCKIAIYRKDFSRPIWGIAKYSEYVQTTRDGVPTKMWKEKPEVMLAKCAECQGLRKAFPQELSNVYSSEEWPEEDAPPQKVKAKAKSAPKLAETRAAATLPAPSVEAVQPAAPEPVKVAPEAPKQTIEATGEVVTEDGQVVAPSPYAKSKLTLGAKMGELMCNIQVPGLCKYRDKYADKLSEEESAALAYWISTVPWEDTKAAP